MNKKTYNISGVTCNHCVSKVKNALEQMEGVKKISFSDDNQKINIQSNEDIRMVDMNAKIETLGDYKIL
jgi:copper chaperone CopZ